jgi:hypothetical protein
MTATSSPAEPPESTLAAVVEYVVGFAFDTDGRVALIRKNRPEWQAGRLNGIGGHVEATGYTADDYSPPPPPQPASPNWRRPSQRPRRGCVRSSDTRAVAPSERVLAATTRRSGAGWTC